MILNDMEKWLISPKTRYMYHHFGFGITFQDLRSHHTVSVQISPPQYSMYKIAFSASETTILPM